MRGKIPVLLCSLEKANLNHWTVHVKVEVTLRLTVSHFLSELLTLLLIRGIQMREMSKLS
jgi:hypothetical protein